MGTIYYELVSYALVFIWNMTKLQLRFQYLHIISKVYKYCIIFSLKVVNPHGVPSLVVDERDCQLYLIFRCSLY